ncbi:MAG: cytochrome c [Herminiimonas sp.]|nr:cytochrome c [Herminiimonas sp.]
MTYHTASRVIATALSCLALLAISSGADAQDADKVFAGADRKVGMVLHEEKNCAACHAQRLGGDGSSIYTRIDRKVKTPAKLLAQVALCNAQLSSAMFPDDERDVAAFLNHDYYHFK